MSNVINFSVEVNPDNKDVAIKAMMLIAAMADVSMREMANCVEGIEVVDEEEVKGPSGVAAPMKKVEDEKPVKSRSKKKKAAKAEEKAEKVEAKAEKVEAKAEKVEEKAEEPKKEKLPKKEREDSAVDKYEADKAKESKEGKKEDATIEDVRRALKDVVQDNRDAIVEKLGEFGAKSVSTLPEDKYGEMYAYLLDLKSGK